MALTAYCDKITAFTQGDIKGGVTQTKREGWIAIHSASHTVKSPRDAHTGLATGRRQHMPFNFTADYDKALPLLYAALVNNEVLKTVSFKFYSPTKLGVRGAGDGVEQLTFTIVLENAHLADITFRSPNSKNPDLMKLENYVDYSLTYQKITWTWVEGGVTASDDWETQNFTA